MLRVHSLRSILRSLVALAIFVVIGGCNNNSSGTIDAEKAPPVGLENETRPLKAKTTKGS